ncbi:hypothetical protein HAP94_04525 [Acidithiobacillus ferrivorans]|nr:hypothetical protein [Acidithiobacillus ferrivorans]
MPEQTSTEHLNAVLVAMHHGGTIRKSRQVESAPFILHVRGDSAAIPAGLIHSLTQQGLITHAEYVQEYMYTLTPRGRTKARNLVTQSR